MELKEGIKNFIYVILGIVFVFAIYFSYLYFKQINQNDVSSEVSSEKIKELENSTKEILSGEVVSVDQNIIKLKVGENIEEIKIDNQTKIVKVSVSDDLTNTFEDLKIEDVKVGARGNAFISKNSKNNDIKIEKFEFIIPTIPSDGH